MRLSRRWLCRHKVWAPREVIWTEMFEDTLTLSWSSMSCEKCGKVRENNVMKPGEQVVLVLEDWL